MKGLVTPLIKRVVTSVAILALVVGCGSPQMVAQEPQHYTQKQLHLMMASASNATDYQKLATYFHYQELMFRTKAQKVLDQYAIDGAKHMMATKTVSRADVANRDYADYSSKANKNAALAARYDEKLSELGVTPDTEPSAVVSLRRLQEGRSGTPGEAMLGGAATASHN